MVKHSGFKHWVVLKPAFMFENFLPSIAASLFPTLVSKGVVETAMTPETKLNLIAADDIAKFATAAFAEPARFNKQEIDLASESLTMQEIATALARATDKQIETRFMSEDDAMLLDIDRLSSQCTSGKLWKSIKSTFNGQQAWVFHLRASLVGHNARETCLNKMFDNGWTSQQSQLVRLWLPAMMSQANGSTATGPYYDTERMQHWFAGQAVSMMKNFRLTFFVEAEHDTIAFNFIAQMFPQGRSVYCIPRQQRYEYHSTRDVLPRLELHCMFFNGRTFSRDLYSRVKLVKA